MIDLLSPVGNFECLKAAVQNGANSVYFGANLFNARASADNFSLDELKQAIFYAKLRGVKTNLTLNILLKDDEFEDALELASKAYEFGIDAIIVQDLGLAMELIRRFPDLPIHASTQMSVHNLNGALKLQELGFKRVVLAREVSSNEIEHICKNSNIEIECFVHGALCISYSGQCLFSSMMGGRSGNRGQCAQPCRLPYELLENSEKINSGYLLSTRDLCGLDYIPTLIKAGVTCLKIEGRMKSPEYVATVTRIYRKYIDLAYSDKPYEINPNDRKELMQVFNRGMSSSGHLDSKGNRNLIFKEKPNNMGLFLGYVQNYNKNKGHITLKLNELLKVGDRISLENESSAYTVSEIMIKNKNISETHIGQIITIGRMKGNIKSGDKIYKISSKELLDFAKESYQKEYKKMGLSCLVSIKNSEPISITVKSANKFELYKDLNINCKLDTIPEIAKNRPLTKEAVCKQIEKTSSTPFEFKNISVDLDENVFLPKLSTLNELRRLALDEVEKYIFNKIQRTISNSAKLEDYKKCISEKHNYKISVLLNILNLEFDYSKLENIDKVYIPLKYFSQKKYENILSTISQKFETYIYMPTIIRANYRNLLYSHSEIAIKKYNIKGFVISNICNFKLLNDLFSDLNEKFDIICNYTFNVFNQNTISELKKIGAKELTLSPELDNSLMADLCNKSDLPTELIVYGKLPLINMNYCLLGETDRCYPECSARCMNENDYYLKDRLGMKFKILPDNIQTVTTIFNTKNTLLNPKDFNLDCARIDILDESIDEINSIVKDKKF